MIMKGYKLKSIIKAHVSDQYLVCYHLTDGVRYAVSTCITVVVYLYNVLIHIVVVTVGFDKIKINYDISCDD